MRQFRRLFVTTTAITALSASAAMACGFLVAENGAISLDTFTAVSILEDDGDAHYVTAFSFSGVPELFGAVIPLPDIPTDVEKAPGWFLQRLVRETTVQQASRFAAEGALAADSAEVIATYEVDSLDIVILKGGGQDVLDWAADNGFDLGVRDGDVEDQSDAIAMLDFYAERSPIFAAVKFDNQRAAEQEVRSGDGIPVRFSFEDQDEAWIPVKVLGFDKGETDLVVADLFLMTPGRPTILGGNVPGTNVVFQQSYGPDSSLVIDLTDDERAEWVPTSFTLTRIDVRTETRLIDWDVAAAVGRQPHLTSAFGDSWAAAVSGGTYLGTALHSADPQVVRAVISEESGSPIWWVAGAVALLGGATLLRRRSVSVVPN